MTLLIKGGTIVTATDQYKGDVFVDGEKISTIGTSLTRPADRVIDAAGKYLFPGGIDVHTHLDMIEEVRRVWQFYRDRRPDSYGPMAQDSTL